MDSNVKKFMDSLQYLFHDVILSCMESLGMKPDEISSLWILNPETHVYENVKKPSIHTLLSMVTNKMTVSLYEKDSDGNFYDCDITIRFTSEKVLGDNDEIGHTGFEFTYGTEF